MIWVCLVYLKEELKLIFYFADYRNLPGCCPNPPGAEEVPNGFLFAASSLGLPPRPLKNPPPAFVPLALAGLEPKTLPPDGGCCCKRVNNNMH